MSLISLRLLSRPKFNNLMTHSEKFKFNRTVLLVEVTYAHSCNHSRYTRHQWASLRMINHHQG